jgi:hypothetical protein
MRIGNQEKSFIKQKTSNTYLEVNNYWTPLQQEEDEEEEEAEKQINTTQTIKTTPKGNKWTRRATRQKESRMIVDSGATSHFVIEDMNLPETGPSNKTIYLPNNTTLKASAKTMLPFNQLTDKAREAEILPGLKRPLMSINTTSKEGYTTIFHPGEEGVTVHKPGTLQILTTDKPVLTGTNSNGLWTIATKEIDLKENINHAYSIPSMEGKI